MKDKNGNQENYISNISSNPTSSEMGEEMHSQIPSDGKNNYRR